MNTVKVYLTQISKGSNIETFVDILFIKDNIIDCFIQGVPSDNELMPFLNTLENNNNVNDDIYNWLKNHFIAKNERYDMLKEQLNIVKETLLSFSAKDISNNVLEIKDLYKIANKLNDIFPDSYFVRDNNIYYKDIKVALPRILLYNIQNSYSDKYTKSLHLFWLNCLRKENYSNIEDLFEFIYDNGLTITPNGYLFTFRRIVTKNSPKDKRLFIFVLQTWLDNIKESISNHETYIGYDSVLDEYFYIRNDVDLPEELEILGTVYDLYQQLKDSDFTIEYTDNHTKTFNYKVGHTYIVNNVDSNPHNTCSYGLHLGSKHYVKNNSWLGDTIVGCLVNPSDIIAVSDSFSKLRVRKMHIVTIVDDIDSFNASLFDYDFEEVEKSDIIESLTYNFNENYLNREKNKIDRKINELSDEKLRIQSELDRYNTITSMSLDDIRNMLNSQFIKNEAM